MSQGLLRTLLCLLDGLGPRDAGRIRGLLGSPPSAHPVPDGEDGEGLIHELVHNCLFAVSSSSTGQRPFRVKQWQGDSAGIMSSPAYLAREAVETCHSESLHMS